MSNATAIYLHIGIHKTGTTSLQTYLHQHRAWLEARNFAFYEGIYLPENHAELHGAAMRPERRSPFKDFHGITEVADLRRQVSARVRSFIERNAGRNLIFSAEGLAYLRHQDEIDYLADLFAPKHTTIIVYLRDKAEFLRSYRNQLLRFGLPLSADRDSYTYCEHDSWLVDFDALVGAYAHQFPDIRIMRYGEIMARDGTIIASFLNEVGLPNCSLADTRLFLNATPGPDDADDGSPCV